jgi:hypothetical protein
VTLNDLLIGKGIDPKDVLVFRHRPHEVELNKVLPWLAAERHELFNAYQSSQENDVETAMLQRRYIASFIRYGPKRALFVGLYSIDRWTPLTQESYFQIPAIVELKSLGFTGFQAGKTSTTSTKWFDLSLTDFHREWKGKLIIEWRAPRRFWQKADGKDEKAFEVAAILEDSALTGVMPAWQELVLTYEQLAVLPQLWRAKLSEWRGIYYILDLSDGKGYVGAAYGSENILGRWLTYADTGHGDNQKLRDRDPRNFRFSILQRVSPDMDDSDVNQVENTWKVRLHTREHGLNGN